MATVNCYLAFEGTCEAAFNFYKSVFGGEFTHFALYKDMPEWDNLPESQQKLVLHVSLPISKETVLFGCDSMRDYVAGNNVSITITPDTAEEAKRLFDGLSEGGSIEMPLSKTYWAELFGMFTDRFGVNWMVNKNDK